MQLHLPWTYANIVLMIIPQADNGGITSPGVIHTRLSSINDVGMV